jgi:hypothetical protein
MSERKEQQRTLLMLSQTYAPHGLFWTADVLTGVPISSIKSLPARAKKAYASGGLKAVLDLFRRLPVLTAGIEGGPDIQGSLHGLWIGIEMKSKTGRQRESQARFQRAVEKAGGIYIIARSAEQAIQCLEQALADRNARPTSKPCAR